MKIIVAILLAFSIGFLQRMPASGEDFRKREIQKKARALASSGLSFLVLAAACSSIRSYRVLSCEF